MNAVAIPVAVHRPLSPEEAAHASSTRCCTLQAPPDRSLLLALAAASLMPRPGGDPRLSKAWRDLVPASWAMDEDAALDEYDALSAASGNPPSRCTAGSIRRHGDRSSARAHPRGPRGPRPRAARKRAGGLLSGLFDSMRVLVAGGAGRGPTLRSSALLRIAPRPRAAGFIRGARRRRESELVPQVAALGCGVPRDRDRIVRVRLKTRSKKGGADENSQDHQPP